MFLEILLLIAALVGYVYWQYKTRVQHWSRLGVKEPSQKSSFPFGSHPTTHPDVIFRRISTAEAIHQQYNEMKGEKYYGTYGAVAGAPVLIINDLDLAEHVLVKDFSSFVDRRFGGFEIGRGTSDTDLMWKKQLLNLKGEEWKEVRSAFSPIFTSGRMKMMTHFLSSVSGQLEEEFSKAARDGSHLDLNALCGKFTMENIASCAFGVTSGAFSNDKESPFVVNAHRLFSIYPWDSLMTISYMTPGLRQLIDFFKIPVMKSVESRFFMDIVSQTIRERLNGKQGWN
jgi:cytochrome P450